MALLAWSALGCAAASGAALPSGLDGGIPEDAAGTDSAAPEAGPPAPDAAVPACSPGDVSHFRPTYTPPVGPYAGACDYQQVDSLVNSCLDANVATATSCSAWINAAANSKCFSCWVGPTSANYWAPIVYEKNPGETDWVNLAGCIALADPAMVSCAKAVEADFTCDEQACLLNCPVPQDPASPARPAALTALNACITAADDPTAGGCGTFATPANACVADLAGSPAAFCKKASPPDGSQPDPYALKQFIGLACGYAQPAPDAGPPPADAGID